MFFSDTSEKGGTTACEGREERICGAVPEGRQAGIDIRVCNDTDTDSRYRRYDDTEKRSLSAFATAEAILTPYLEVTEHTRHYLHNMSMFVLCWCYACIITHYDQYEAYYFYEIKVKHLFAA